VVFWLWQKTPGRRFLLLQNRRAGQATLISLLSVDGQTVLLAIKSMAEKAMEAWRAILDDQCARPGAQSPISILGRWCSVLHDNRIVGTLARVRLTHGRTMPRTSADFY
jgi:hypothetical protein